MRWGPATSRTGQSSFTIPLFLTLFIDLADKFDESLSFLVRDGFVTGTVLYVDGAPVLCNIFGVKAEERLRVVCHGKT